MKAQLKFLGAAGQVTGSRCLFRFNSKTYLIDCGLYQGTPENRAKNWESFDIPAKTIDAVFLTHAHIDHSGYLPKLYKEGFAGTVHCSEGTADLCDIMLRDSAKLQEEDADYANKTKHSRFSPALPLYTMVDAEGVLKQFKGHRRNEWIQLDQGLSFRFLRSGHIIGSSFLQFSLTWDQGSKILSFSGDVGHDRSQTLKGPDTILETDTLVLESTYGNREHSRVSLFEELAAALSKTLKRGGVVVIPAFAVGRTQEILYCIRHLEIENKIPKVPVILDSPMAQAATEVFLKHAYDSRIDSAFLGEKVFFPELFEATTSADDSMVACMREGPMIVISASGMLSGGRVLHHLKHRLPDAKNLLLFVGYQAEGSKGRYLLEQGKTSGDFRIHHEVIPVEAEIITLDSFSGHADYIDLLKWLGSMQKLPKQIFINHGTPESSQALAIKIREKWPDIKIELAVLGLNVALL